MNAAKAGVVKPPAGWVAKVAAGDTSVVASLKPPNTSVLENSRKGSFLIQKGDARRSVSWSLRGTPAAIKLALCEAWRIREMQTGEVCPFKAELDALPD